MNLDEKIQKAKSCRHYRKGICSFKAYPPFDCDKCKTYYVRKAIAIDFDGCLCSHAFPGIGKPNWEVINKAIEEQKSGAALILWTCRVNERLQEAVAACAEWGLVFDAVNANLPERIVFYGSDCRKVSADEYWDDLGGADRREYK